MFTCVESWWMGMDSSNQSQFTVIFSFCHLCEWNGPSQQGGANSLPLIILIQLWFSFLRFRERSEDHYRETAAKLPTSASKQEIIDTVLTWKIPGSKLWKTLPKHKRVHQPDFPALLLLHGSSLPTPHSLSLQLHDLDGVRKCKLFKNTVIETRTCDNGGDEGVLGLVWHVFLSW